MSPDTTDELVPDPKVRRELGGISEMTTWRWDRDPKMAELNWPTPIKINGRNYRSRQGLNKFRETCMNRTIAERAAAAWSPNEFGPAASSKAAGPGTHRNKFGGTEWNVL